MWEEGTGPLLFSIPPFPPPCSLFPFCCFAGIPRNPHCSPSASLLESGPALACLPGQP